MEPELSAESSEDDFQVKKFRFTDALTEVPNGDAEAAEELLLSDRKLTSVDSLEAFKKLKKLELRGNCLKSLGFLEMNHGLCWLGLAKNKLRKISSLLNLSSLAVLDLSDNKVSRLTGLEGLQGLKALILARNRIAILDGLSPKQNPLLETLVLSHNQIQQCGLTGFKHLKKLSLGHNCLHAFPALKKLPALVELRLNGNKLLAVSPTVASLPHLGTLDVGNNLIKQESGFEALRGLLWLTNLNVRGNMSEGDELPDKLQELVASLPRLEILNGKRQSGKTRKRRRHNGRDMKLARLSQSRTKRGARDRGTGRGTGRGRGAVYEEESEAVPLRARGRGGRAAAQPSSSGRLVKMKASQVGKTTGADLRAQPGAEAKELRCQKLRAGKPEPGVTAKSKKTTIKKKRAGQVGPAS